MCECHRWVCDKCLEGVKDYEQVTIGGPLLLDQTCFVCDDGSDRDNLNLITRRVAERLRAAKGGIEPLPGEQPKVAVGVSSKYIAVFDSEEEARQAVVDVLQGK